MKNPEFSFWGSFLDRHVVKVDPADIPYNCLKYFDGCNECDVQHPGKIFDWCSTNQCDTLWTPECRLYILDPEIQISMDKCDIYFDGCNECKIKMEK
jgi:hypothetical protein